jgi:hypothetical protein
MMEADKAPDLPKAEKLARALHNVLSGGRSFDRNLAAQCRDELRTLAARVDALIKERDEAREELSDMKLELAKLLVQTTLARGNETALAHAIKAERDQALARLGAVERETLGKAATVALNGNINVQGYQGLALEISNIPLNTDAAAALDRAIAKAVQDERDACADLVGRAAKSFPDNLAWCVEDLAKAILDRGEKPRV